MNLSPRLLAGSAIALIGLSAFWLNGLRSAVHLGKPGVKLTSVPVLDEQSRIARTNSVALPLRVPGFEARLANITRMELEYLPPDTTYARRFYALPNEGFSVQASAVLMGTDRTSIHRPEYCLTGQGWTITRQRSLEIGIAGSKPYKLPVQRYDMTYQGEVDGRLAIRSGIYVFWFVADGQLTSSHVQRQWWLIRDLLLHQTLQRWAYISFFADCAPGDEDLTYDRITRLVAATVPDFQLTTGATP
jgi:hypothetical protein